MSVPLKFKFPISILVRDGDYILTAAEARAADIGPRLKAGAVAALRALHGKLKGDVTTQASTKADAGTLTVEQNAALATAKKLVSKARDSAKLAFPGQTVKLHNEFQVGNSDSQSLPDFVHGGNIIAAGCAVPANAAALAENGWIAADTTALSAALGTLEKADTVQEEGKGKAPASTDARNIDANTRYDGLDKIQNAADLQYPEDNPASGPHRAAFRMDSYPPTRGGGDATPSAPDQPQPPKT